MGALPTKVQKVLDYIACPSEENGTWFYDGSLDRLQKKLEEVDAMFFVAPYSNIIFVTQHNSWGNNTVIKLNWLETKQFISDSKTADNSIRDAVTTLVQKTYATSKTQSVSE